MPVVEDTFDLDRVKHLLLIGVGADLKTHQADGDAVRTLDAFRFKQRVVKPVTVALWVVGLEFGAVPVGVERRSELVQQAGRSCLAESDVPLDTLKHRGGGEVGRAHVGSVEAGVAPEKPRLGVKARALGVVLHLDLSAEVGHKPIQRFALGAADVGSRHDPDRDASCTCCCELPFDQAQSMPHDERAEQVDRVSRADLSAKLGSETRFATCVGE